MRSPLAGKGLLPSHMPPNLDALRGRFRIRREALANASRENQYGRNGGFHDRGPSPGQGNAPVQESPGKTIQASHPAANHALGADLGTVSEAEFCPLELVAA